MAVVAIVFAVVLFAMWRHAPKLRYYMGIDIGGPRQSVAVMMSIDRKTGTMVIRRVHRW